MKGKPPWDTDLEPKSEIYSLGSVPRADLQHAWHSLLEAVVKLDQRSKQPAVLEWWDEGGERS